MRKILFVINTLGRAGAENAMITLMRRLPPEKYDISLFVLTGQGDMRAKLPEYVRLINSSYSDSSVLDAEGRKILKKTCIRALLHRGNLFRRFTYVAGNFFKMVCRGKILPDKLLWRVLADDAERFDEEYDLAVAYLEGGATYYTADYVRAKKKAAFVHVDYELAGYTRDLDRDCYDRIDSIFAVSDEVKDSFIKVHEKQKKKVRVFHNLLDRELIISKSEEPVDFDKEYNGIKLLTVGRLTAQKAFEVSVQAMEILKKRNIPARWYVLGDGDKRSYLEKIIAEKGLEKDFILMGAVDNPYPYIRQCTLYVHATKFEGKSIAIQEAQILGKAIIASDCSGNREQIENGADGILCEFTPEAIADSIVKLIDDKELREHFGTLSLVKNHEENKAVEMFTSLIQRGIADDI